MEKLKTITIPKIISILFTLLFSSVVINTIFFNKTTTIDFSKKVMLFGALISYLGIFIMYLFSKRLSRIYIFFEDTIKRYKWWIVLIIVFLQLVIVGLAYKNCGFDCGYVIVHAYKLLNGEITDGIFDISYFSNYTNNLTILYLFKYIFQFVNQFFEVTEQNIFLITAILNIIMIDIAEIVMLKISRRLFSTKMTNLIFLFSIPLIIFNPYMIVTYTDTLSMCIPLLIFYLYLKIKDNSKLKYVYVFLEGVLLIGGYYIKPTVIIIGVAVIISEVLFFGFKELKTKISKKYIIEFCTKLVIFLISILFTMSVFSWFKTNIVQKLIPDWIIELNAVPPTHFLMMGLNSQEQPGPGKNKTVYGSYYVPDVFGTLAIKGKSNKIQYNLSVIKQRLEDYKITGYIGFLYKKLNWIISDGTFYYGQEGGFYNDDFINKSNGAMKIQKYFDINSHFYQNYVANIMQIVWIVILFGLVFTYKNNKKDITILKFSIVGIIMFILLFEGRSRYLYNYIPIFIMVAVLGIKNIIRIIEGFYKKTERQNNKEISIEKPEAKNINNILK